MPPSLTFAELAAAACRPGAGRLDDATLAQALALLPGWEKQGERLVKEFAFEGYAATLAFVNAVARMAEEQDHHPEITFGYDRCRVAWTTHALGTLSHNDLVCAAQTERLARP